MSELGTLKIQGHISLAFMQFFRRLFPMLHSSSDERACQEKLHLMVVNGGEIQWTCFYFVLLLLEIMKVLHEQSYVACKTCPVPTVGNIKLYLIDETIYVNLFLCLT